MPKVRVTDRAECVAHVRHRANGNSLFIYIDHNVGRRGETRWYRVFKIAGERISHSTMQRETAAQWLKDAIAPDADYEILKGGNNLVHDALATTRNTKDWE